MRLKSFLLLLVSLVLIISGCGQSNKNQLSGKSEGEYSDFPKKPIEILVPYAPGGGTDLIARTLAKHLPKHLPNEQSITVVNQDGGGGIVGTTNFLKAKPDGYEILMAPISLFTNTVLLHDVSYEKDSFEPLVKVATARQMLLVQENAPWKDFDEWLNYVKENPGKFSYGVTAIGSKPHIAMELLAEEAGLDVKAVPYGGVGPAKTDLIGGHVDGVVGPINGSDRGTLRPLISYSGERGENSPDVPILKESGYKVTIDVIQAMFVPKDLPEEIKNILHDAIKKTMEDPDFIEEFKKTELDLTYASPEDLKEEIEAEYKLFEDMLENMDFEEE